MQATIKNVYKRKYNIYKQIKIYLLKIIEISN